MSSSSAGSAPAAAGRAGRLFWKPGTIAPGSTVDREQQQEEGFLLPVALQHANSSSTTSSSPGAVSISSSSSTSSSRLLLPIAGRRRQILYAVEKHQVMILVGETASGKSTQIPQYLYEAGWCSTGQQIAVTQPRRVAVTSLAARVSEECKTTLGQLVGYAIRFEQMTSESTRIKFLTDGLLLRETMSDPLLSAYSVIMLDEAHERSVSTDVLMALLRKICLQRPEFKLIISSATMDAERFLDYFQSEMPNGDPSACILTVEGRQFPVDVFYSQMPVHNYVQAAIDTVQHIARTQPAGDILVFMSGREEIEKVCSGLLEENALNLKVLPLFAGLSAERQMEVFAPAAYAQRKVIVSTNVAEASVTIDGIAYVVDTGFAKLRYYDPLSHVSNLVVTPISQAAAIQRSGRSGRTKRGVAYRLYTEAAFYQLPQRTTPEFQRSNLVTTLLQLKALGIDQIISMDFMDPPPLPQLTKAMEVLYSLEAVDENGRLTRIGHILSELPLEPTLGKMILASAGIGRANNPTASTNPSSSSSSTSAATSASISAEFINCSEEVLSIAAMLSVDNIFLNNPRARPSNSSTSAAVSAALNHFGVHEGDHLTWLNVFNAFMAVRKKDPAAWCHRNGINLKAIARAVQIRKQLKHTLNRFHIDWRSSQGNTVAIRKAILSGFFINIAHLQTDGTYQPLRPPSFRHNRSASTDATDIKLHIHPSSILYATTQSAAKPRWLVFHEVVTTTKSYMQDMSVIDPSWILAIAPHFFQQKSPFEQENKRHEAIVAASVHSHLSGEAAETDGVIGEPGKKHRRLF